MSEPWHSDQWFTSPWNYLPEVRAPLALPASIKIHDITLRDGEQQTGVALSADEKVRIAEELAAAGVHRIEAGMPIVSAADREAIERIVRLELPSEIFCFARCMVPDVERAADCGVKGIIVEIPASEHIIRTAYNWPLQKALDLSIEATSRAKELGLYTVFFPIDASRAELGWYLDLITKVATEGHMDALACVDTFGGTSPSAIPYLVRTCRERLGKPVEAHFHDDFGCATANTLLGLAAGAEVAHVTVAGVGERAGNAALEQVVLGLLTMYGVDVGVDTTRLVSLAETVREAFRLAVPDHRSIIGRRIFQIESGIVASWVQQCGEEHLLELFPYRPELVGQQPVEVTLGKSSGADSVHQWLARLGLDPVADQDTLLRLLAACKQKSIEKKGLLTEDEFKGIVETVRG